MDKSNNRNMFDDTSIQFDLERTVKLLADELNIISDPL